MTYRETRKARKMWAENAVAKKAALRELEIRDEFIDIDPYIEITIRRRHTGEVAVFECFEGTRIDNYSVYCNEIYQGVQGITTLTSNIRKAIPRFRRID